jgi:hypothetical protein
MENVEIKEEVTEVVKKKPAKKAAPKKEASDLQKFMIGRNEARKKAGIKEPAYTEEQIKNAK